MKEMATFTQTNGLQFSLDPDTITCVKGLPPNKEHKVRTIIYYDKDRSTTIIKSHDEVMKVLNRKD